MKDKPILQIKNLNISFNSDRGPIRAVNDLNLEINKGEIFGIVGESGSGKTVTSLSIIKLLSESSASIQGQILFQNQNLLRLSESKIQSIRGKEISMVFQDPMSALNPVFTIGNQIEEVIKLHQGLSSFKAKQKVLDVLKLVGIANPEKRIYEYPHQLSGGLCQRVMIAIALSCNPKIVILDEPTTSLDVTIQAQILDLVKQIQLNLGLTVIMISHDLGVIAEICDRVAVMYAGKIIEKGSVNSIFKNYKHPYTKALFESRPIFGEGCSNKKLFSIDGDMPNGIDKLDGCDFESRCNYTTDKCSKKIPQLEEIEGSTSHYASCWNMQ